MNVGLNIAQRARSACHLPVAHHHVGSDAETTLPLEQTLASLANLPSVTLSPSCRGVCLTVEPHLGWCCRRAVVLPKVSGGAAYASGGAVFCQTMLFNGILLFCAWLRWCCSRHWWPWHLVVLLRVAVVLPTAAVVPSTAVVVHVAGATDPQRRPIFELE